MGVKMANNALICPTQDIYNYAVPPVKIGVAIVDNKPETYPVAEPFYWVSCANNVDFNTYYYDGTNCVLKPTAPAQEYALISPNDKIYDNSYTPPVLLGYRVVAVSTVQNTPPAPLYWVACPNNVTPTGYYYDGNGGFAVLPAGA
jgi:hypothetical protein